MVARPITRDWAREYINANHRHHKAPVGWKFGVAAYQGEECLGILTAGRPVSRELAEAEPLTIEVNRLCTTGAKNVCSFLYSRARRIAREMGYTRIITYILANEPGTSLKAAGWKFVKFTRGGSWDRPSRGRQDKAPTESKQLWESHALSHKQSGQAE